MVYIIYIFLNEYGYIRDCLDICIYSCLGGGLGSLPFGVEGRRDIYPWDIFSWALWFLL